MSWELLTEVYNLETDRLYVTYFGGDARLGLEADLESRDLWLQLGSVKSSCSLVGISQCTKPVLSSRLISVIIILNAIKLQSGSDPGIFWTAAATFRWATCIC